MAAYLGSYGPQLLAGMTCLVQGLSSWSTRAIRITPKMTRQPLPWLVTMMASPIGSVMQRRLEILSNLGIPTEFHHYPGLGHGFGLGTGTASEGWFDKAVAFWEAQMKK